MLSAPAAFCGLTCCKFLLTSAMVRQSIWVSGRGVIYHTATCSVPQTECRSLSVHQGGIREPVLGLLTSGSLLASIPLGDLGNSGVNSLRHATDQVSITDGQQNQPNAAITHLYF